MSCLHLLLQINKSKVYSLFLVTKIYFTSTKLWTRTYFLVRSATSSIVNLKMKILADLNLKRWKLTSFQNGMSSYQEYVSSQGQIKSNSAKIFKVRYTRKTFFQINIFKGKRASICNSGWNLYGHSWINVFSFRRASYTGIFTVDSKIGWE